jgi:SNF2 family DNA or RNA helicase
MWQIVEGTLYLTLSNGELYRPKALDIFLQKDKCSFEYMGVSYPPLSETGLRFSGLTAKIAYEILLEDDILFKVYCSKGSNRFYVATNNGIFNDYVIYENTWRYIDPIVYSINDILSKNVINPQKLSYKQYVLLINELSALNIAFDDNVGVEVSKIKKSEEFNPPHGLQATLYPYQLGGTKWLDFMIRQNCGSILGDEMGLGKTLQIISVMGLLKERKKDSHFLVVSPISLMENWKREILRFYPSLSTYVHYGANRTGNFNDLYKHDVTIMPYSCVVTDAGLLSMTQWDLLVIDEAQNIKNPNARRTKAIKRINSKVSIAVTGTPFENHMTDIWSLVDFVMPGYLGNISTFERTFTDNLNSAAALEKKISPLLLRRRVKDVAKDLPERVDIPQPIIMSYEEACLYEANRSGDPFEKLNSMQLDQIQKLRTFCTHPYVYDAEYECSDPTEISTKYTRLCEILDEIFKNKEKVVIFTSFKRMIDLMLRDISTRYNVYVNFIDGTVEATDRQKIVDDFTSVEGPGALILNPKAAGVGLNITCANHAIHYNLEWNPAVEDQASARIYRRGQQNTVFIHRFFYVDTIEDVINEKIQHKRLLSENAIIGHSGAFTEQEYLIKALSISPYKPN